MLAAARARLAVAGLPDSRKHQGVHTALHNLYRHDAGRDNPGKVLQRAYDCKQADDYGGGRIGAEEAALAVGTAVAFVGRLKVDSGFGGNGGPALPPEADPAMIEAILRRSRGTGA